MACDLSSPRLDRINPLKSDIVRIWSALRQVDQDYISRYVGGIPWLASKEIEWALLEAASDFWDTDRAVFNIQGTEITPTVEEYRSLIRRPVNTQGPPVAPEFYTSEHVSLSRLLGVKKNRIKDELGKNGGKGIRITFLVEWMETRMRLAVGGSCHVDVCNCYLLLVFGTLLFPLSANLIDASLASVVLQVVGGCSFEVALVAETMRSLDYIKVRRCGRMRGSPILLQMWFLSHIKAYASLYPSWYRYPDESPLIRANATPMWRNAREWKRFLLELSPLGFLWRARWFSGTHIALRCPNFEGIPLVSHLGSTAYFPARVIRQLGGLQVIPGEASRQPYQHDWKEVPSIRDRFVMAQRFRASWETRISAPLYFPESPTQEEADFFATPDYVLLFHRRSYPLPDSAELTRHPPASPVVKVLTEKEILELELQTMRAERDGLRLELKDARTDEKEREQMPSELHKARVQVARRDKIIDSLVQDLARERKRARENLPPAMTSSPRAPPRPKPVVPHDERVYRAA